jgi:hypothetical protein
VPLTDIVDLSVSAFANNSKFVDMRVVKTKASAVVAGDLIPGSWAVIDDGTDVRLYANRAGTLVKSAALT